MGYVSFLYFNIFSFLFLRLSYQNHFLIPSLILIFADEIFYIHFQPILLRVRAIFFLRESKYFYHLILEIHAIFQSNLSCTLEFFAWLALQQKVNTVLPNYLIRVIHFHQDN